MNGLKYIREKSNFAKSSLAERIGVTRQTINLWERGARKPSAKNLKWLSDFYGIQENWFGELSDDEMQTLQSMWMYRHYDGDKEYYTFIPEHGNGDSECRYQCGLLWSSLDEIYSQTLKDKKDFLTKVARYLEFRPGEKTGLCDKIIVARRGMDDIDRYLALMKTVESESSVLKMPLRQEIKTVIYAMMIATGFFSIDEIKEKYHDDFVSEYSPDFEINVDYLNSLINLMSAHWMSEIKKLKTREEKHGYRTKEITEKHPQIMQTR